MYDSSEVNKSKSSYDIENVYSSYQWEATCPSLRLNCSILGIQKKSFCISHALFYFSYDRKYLTL